MYLLGVVVAMDLRLVAANRGSALGTLEVLVITEVDVLLSLVDFRAGALLGFASELDLTVAPGFGMLLLIGRLLGSVLAGTVAFIG